MNSEEEFYDAETGEAGKHTSHIKKYTCLLSLGCLSSLPSSSSSCLHQGWSQMIPVKSVLKMPWCLTASRGLTAAPHRRMECGSAGEETCRRSVVCPDACHHMTTCLWVRGFRGSLCMHTHVETDKASATTFFYAVS